jgi:hypothetical protein
VNKIERAILNRVKEVAKEYFLEEIAKIQEQISDERAEKIYLDVLNTGVLLDVNKVKKHGLNLLVKQIKSSTGKATEKRENIDKKAEKRREKSGEL